MKCPVYALLAIGLILAGCASTDSVSMAKNLFYRGDYSDALSYYSNIDVLAKKDRALAQLEYASTLMAAGKSAESAAAFNAAADRFRKQDIVSVHQTLLDLTVSDAVTDYRPSFYERYLLHSLNAINYLLLDQRDAAMVEAKQSLDNLAAYEQHLGGLGFVHYVAGLSYEMNDDINSAYIEYKQAYETGGRPAFLLPKLKKMSWYLSRTEDYNTWQTLAPEALANENYGEAVFLIAKGRAPFKKEFFIMVEDGQKVSVPVYEAGYVDELPLTIFINRDQAYRADVLMDLNPVAAKLNDRQMMKNILKDVIRLQTREKAVETVEKKYGKELGNVLEFALFLLIHPDLRTWQTLAGSFQAKSISLPPGDYTADIPGAQTFQFTVTPARKNIFFARIP